MKDPIRKNLLDIQYQKHLSYFTTAIIVSFTYVVGVFIGIITGQIQLQNPTHFHPLVAASLIVLITSVSIMVSSFKHKRNIVLELKKMRKENET